MIQMKRSGMRVGVSQNPKFIKPIPKYIVDKIRKADMVRCPDQKGECRFYSYLTKISGELVKITVAAKSFYKKWHCKQVAVHGTKSDECWVKDMEYKYYGGGYRVGWYAEYCSKRPQMWYERGWLAAEFKYYNPSNAITVNLNYINNFPQYKYSAYKLFRSDCIVTYLRIYAKYPQVEYLLKLGLQELYNKVTILKLIGKDKQFCKWLIAHKDEIAPCYAGVIIQSYKIGLPIKQTQKIEEFKKKLQRDTRLQALNELFGKDLKQFYTYITSQKSDPFSYIDYLQACRYLGLNMNLLKHRFPKNFKYWHDRRIREYNTAKERADKTKRAELYRQFAAVAEKYLELQNCKQGLYAVFIAKSPADLIQEGEQLQHCVGQMNYDQKMADEETLIFFIRSVAQPDTPLVTIEYSLKSKKVLQCYGYRNTKPDNTILTFVNKTWLSYANRTLKKLYA
jgi:hypothetical protein